LGISRPFSAMNIRALLGLGATAQSYNFISDYLFIILMLNLWAC